MSEVLAAGRHELADRQPTQCGPSAAWYSAPKPCSMPRTTPSEYTTDATPVASGDAIAGEQQPDDRLGVLDLARGDQLGDGGQGEALDGHCLLLCTLRPC